MDIVDRLVRQSDYLFRDEERSNCETQWNDLAKYLFPSAYGRFFGNTAKGQKKTTELYDNTGIICASILASTMHSILTSDAVKWAKLRFVDPKLNDNEKAIAWLQDSNDRFHAAISASNFISEINKAYETYCALGSMCLLMDSASDTVKFDGFVFRALHLAQLAWAENNNGIVDVLYRKFKLSARQAIETWGKDKVGDAVNKAYKETPEKQLEFLLGIYPRDYKRNGRAGLTDPKSRPYAKCVISCEDKHLIEESGYYEFPAMCVRWATLPEESYGMGPGHWALPHVKSLNTLMKEYLRAVALNVRPPLKTTQHGLISRPDLTPNGITKVRDPNDLQRLLPDMNQSLFTTDNVMDQLRGSIKETFFIDKLVFPSRDKIGEMTAAEVYERVNQMEKILGPTFGRLNTELLNPLVVRGFNMMMRGGALLPPPRELSQSDNPQIKIEYVNPLARAQKIGDIQAVQQWIGDLMLLAQAGRPEAIDWANVDEIAEISGRIRGVPENAIQNSEAVTETRKQREQQQQALLDAELATKAADAHSKTAKANGGSTNGSQQAGQI